MPSIGLTGTVGSGKSYALEVLADLGAETLQADKVGHALLGEPEVKNKVIRLFGPGVIGTEGELVRARIGGIIFTDANQRDRYDAIIRPLLLGRLKEWLAKPRPPERVVVLEAALIPEWGIEEWFDEVWCIWCSDETALSRWQREPESYWRIRGAQFAPEKKLAKAERVIENERSKEEYRRRIKAEFSRFTGNLHGGGGGG